jgi:flavin reductase (DIM6/NTAB) family NADH-FMN oxidoreductase RutF
VNDEVYGDDPVTTHFIGGPYRGDEMIHDENPFIEEPERRDPVRRFRGRLTAPVTIVTSGSGERRTGLTVSSLLVIDGDPGFVEMVVGPTSDLWHTIVESGRFVVHICHREDRHLSEVFAGLRPFPGGVFAGVDITDSGYGPIIDRLASRAYCRLVDQHELAYEGLVRGEIDEVTAGDITDPLVYFRGGYHSLG